MADITLDDLTTVSLEGTGVFDRLMKTVGLHLEKEFNAGRINTSEYATVYLGAMQATSSTALQFLLQEQQADKQAELLQAQIDLTTSQKAQVDAETANTVKQGLILDEEKLRITEQTRLISEQADSEAKHNELDGLIDKQIAKVAADTQLVDQSRLTEVQNTSLTQSRVTTESKQQTVLDKQALQLTSETVLTDQRKLTEENQTNLVGSEKLRVDAQTGLISEQTSSEVKQNELNGVIDKQKERLVAEIGLITEQTESEAKQNEVEGLIDKQKAKIVADTRLVTEKVTTEGKQQDVLGSQKLLVDEQKLSETKQHELNGVIDKQKAKLEAETTLLGSKNSTEQAQTTGAITGGTSSIGGVVGAQHELFYTQKEGFKRDAEQKAAKIFADHFNVLASQDANFRGITGTGLEAENVEKIMQKLASGIDVTLTDLNP